MRFASLIVFLFASAIAVEYRGSQVISSNGLQVDSENTFASQDHVLLLEDEDKKLSTTSRQDDTISRETSINEITTMINSKGLSRADRLRIIRTALATFNLLNPNLQLQRNLNKPRIDILHRLHHFSRSDFSFTSPPMNFHLFLARLSLGLHDGHTVYLPPHPLRSARARAGFFTEPFWKPNGKRGFLVTGFDERFNIKSKYFKVGVELLKVDGKPVLQEVLRIGRKGFAKSDDGDRIRDGALYLGSRPFLLEILRQKFLNVQYKDLKGVTRTISLPLRIFSSFEPEQDSMSTSEQGKMAIGFDPIQKRAYVNDPFSRLQSYSDPTRDEFYRHKVARKSMDSEASHFTDLPTSTRQQKQTVTRKRIPVTGNYSEALEASLITIKTGNEVTKVGYLKWTTFSVRYNELLLMELYLKLRSIFDVFPTDKLIFDIQDNGGGLAGYVDFFANTIFRPRQYSYPLAIRPNEVNAAVFGDFPIIRQYLGTEEFFTSYVLDIVYDPLVAGLSLPRLFSGKVVLLTNSYSASASDLMAAFCKDSFDPVTQLRNIPIIGTDPTTAGAGASTVDADEILGIGALEGRFDPNVNITGLGIYLATAWYRFNRGEGALIEYFGVPVDYVHKETRRDVLQNDYDLILFASSVLDNFTSLPINFA